MPSQMHPKTDALEWTRRPSLQNYSLSAQYEGKAVCNSMRTSGKAVCTSMRSGAPMLRMCAPQILVAF